MPKLTNVIHFRGEKVQLYATYKQTSAFPNEVARSLLNPYVKIEYTDANGSVVEVIPPTPMLRISAERYYYVWQIPDDAALTTYIVTYTATVDEVDTFTTEELIVDNPNVTYDRSALRYGPHSFVQRPRDRSFKKIITLPKGDF